MLLTQVIPRKWRHVLIQNLDVSQNSIYSNHHLIKNNCLVSLEIYIQEFYNVIISNTNLLWEFVSDFYNFD